MLDSMRTRIEALGLDLDGLEVVTEAATGAYACTAVIAALAGARVTAMARDTARHGSAEDAFVATRDPRRAGGGGRPHPVREAARRRRRWRPATS